MWLSKNFLFNSKKAVQLIIFVQVLLYFGCKLQIVYVLYRIFHVNKKFILCTYVYPGIRNYRYLQTELGRKPDLWEEGKGRWPETEVERKTGSCLAPTPNLHAQTMEIESEYLKGLFLEIV